ncbi:glutamate--tRNA ligase [Chlorobium phaeobacteroides]|uniref:Glutamate--tRNA ligase n=1 Tax=Chlorobium phaeobacteroides (strain DSM 266 / SMG 266 / 2430) TaxID=290317 RepID=SYE_CHLPD|nr:glutamate--tRNA ligase [Chlorobium phaeobacteroides]A1BDK8.1 RecName: Full=Glutamate--tRNA ligase; AltName: Full=Glutamyl-tRNA synthetase; Short=GluRS [Chlorobium phaeobacteroides DSM 266]ABL64485.1 glutamyl-tRNA synthetase [Chlorobium phaeobacteroides DSM 266]MBV5319748.1 glutamate--tRNA ligase [Chlorobium phaeobacteroides]
MVAQRYRTRFAPSPTGYLHVGGLRTALYNYLFVKKMKGDFVLRIEDTDRSRRVEGAQQNLLKTLEWAGIVPDESPELGGDFGPYIQSERLEIYKKYCDELLEGKYAYYCFATSEELEENRQLQLKQGLQPKYNRKWLPEEMGGSMPSSEIRKKMEQNAPYVIRMKVPDYVSVWFEDLIRGPVEFDSSTIDDQVLMKSDGFPTYHFASVIDDHLMEFTHIIRGEEWLPSMPKHLLLYEFFGWEPPKFAHLPLLLNPDRSKLSKRQGDVAVEDYIRKGYSAEAIVNFVAMLGWNEGEGTEQEVYSLEQLVERFSLERVGKAGAIFNVDKLNWLEKQYIKSRSADRIIAVIKPLLMAELEKRPTAMHESVITSDLYLEQVIELMRERVGFEHEFVTFSPYFFFDPETYEEEGVRKRWTAETNTLLREFVTVLASLDAFTAEAIETELKAFVAPKGLKAAALIHPLRILCSGVSFGPSLYHMLEVLGKDAVIRRISRGIETVVCLS